MRFVVVAAVPLACVGFLGMPTQAKGKIDRREHFYCPEAVSRETYVTRVVTLSQATREPSIGFVTGMTEQELRVPFPPQFAIFAKGDEAQKLIVVALNDTPIGTVFRARKLLAQLTAQVRTMQFFQELGVADFFAFLWCGQGDGLQVGHRL
jgi:hypothetical protein